MQSCVIHLHFVSEKAIKNSLKNMTVLIRGIDHVRRIWCWWIRVINSQFYLFPSSRFPLLTWCALALKVLHPDSFPAPPSDEDVSGRMRPAVHQQGTMPSPNRGSVHLLDHTDRPNHPPYCQCSGSPLDMMLLLGLLLKYIAQLERMMWYRCSQNWIHSQRFGEVGLAIQPLGKARIKGHGRLLRKEEHYEAV